MEPLCYQCAEKQTYPHWFEGKHSLMLLVIPTVKKHNRTMIFLNQTGQNIAATILGVRFTHIHVESHITMTFYWCIQAFQSIRLLKYALNMSHLSYFAKSIALLWLFLSNIKFDLLLRTVFLCSLFNFSTFIPENMPVL